MEYSAAKLHELAPLLKQAQAAAPSHLKQKGKHLIEATTHITRAADLLSPFTGGALMEQLAASYLIPQIHSYVKEVQGQPKTPVLIAFMPATAVAAKAVNAMGWAARLFGGGFEE